MATGLLLWTSCVRQGPNPSKASAHASSVGAIRSLSPVDWTKGVKQLGVLDGLLPVFSADSRTVATVSLEDQTTMLWDVSSGGLLFAFEGYWVTPRGPHDPFAPDGQVIAVPTGENGPTNLWEVSTGRQLASLKGANPHFSNDGRRVATDIGPTGFIGLGPAPEREETIVWEVPTGKRIATLEGAHAWEFAPDGSTLGIGDKLVGADSGKELVTLEGFARGFAPQGNVLATQIDRGDTPPQVKLWAVPSGQLLATLDGEFVDYAPAGTAVVTKGAVPNSVHVWDTSSGALIGTLEGQLRGFSDRGNVVAAEREVGRGPTILLRVDSGQCLGPFEGSFGCLSPDGRLLATDSPVEGDRRSYLWDVGSSQRVAELHSYTSAFSPGGEVIVGPDRTAEGKVTTRVWLASSGKLIATVDGQWRRFSPDGRAFATGPTDDPRSYERGPPTTLWGPAEVRTDGGVGELPEAPGPGTAEPRIPDGLVRPPGCSWVSVEADAPVNDAKAYLSWVSQHAPVAVRHDKTGIELVWVPGGRFIMGSTPEEIDRQWRENDWDGDLKQWTKDEQPAHRVDVAGFWIGRTEVTIGQWWQGLIGGKALEDVHLKHPAVDLVTWDSCQEFLDKTGLQLPTEAQWEYAARGPEGRTYPWGNTWDKALCQSAADLHGYMGTTPVGSFPDGASWCGALDMAGNVSELCADWYDPDAYARYATGDLAPPRTGSGKVVRGGSFESQTPLWLRATSRGRVPPSYSISAEGFRCARRV